MHAPYPLTKELVFIGGGHAHALVLRKWGMNPVPGVRLTLIDPNPTAPYSGMLPGLIAGHYQQADLEIDLVKLARFAGARLILGRAVGIDRAARLVHVAGRAPVFYDHASIDIGITTDMPVLEGFAEHATPAKPLATFVARWEEHLTAATSGARPERVLVIGGGVAGVELALAAAHRLRQAGLKGEVTLLEAGDSILRDLGPGARAALTAQIHAYDIDLRCGVTVRRVTAQGVELADGNHLDGGMVLGVAGARPQAWLAETGLQLTKGFVDVGPDLSTLSDPRIYAVGDIAHLTHAPRPKAGVFAVRQAPVLADNLLADVVGGERRAYRPQRDYLKLISTGSRRAVADKLGLRLEGDWLWRWKNRIDRKFMAQFHELPAMNKVQNFPALLAEGVQETLEGAPPCGGCAAKPGLAALNAGLQGTPTPTRDDILQGTGDDAAVLQVGGQLQVISTDHLRPFTDDPYTLSEIAAVHALGDIWAKGAAPQAALAHVTLPRMRATMQQHMLREIMEAGGKVIRASGADLVGGHTSVGPELSIGFTATGLSENVVGLAGARPGDALILTKPLGVGTIFAAEMQGLANGRDVATALEQMRQAQGAASRVLAPYANAMTDVTGYGLIGHLQTILDASDLGAIICMNDVPFLPGAVALAQAGVRSSLFEQNRTLLDGVGDADDAKIALLVDPQTAGGLLASVPEPLADKLLLSLGQQSSQAVVIGRITDQTGITVQQLL